MNVLAHGLVPLDELARQLAAFGAWWWHAAVPVAVLTVIAGALTVHGRTRGEGVLGRFVAGAARLTGLPEEVAGGLAVLLGALALAARGFFWDVAWHIDIGRDEFLFSPPHVVLLLGLLGVGAAGLVATWAATRRGVGWRLGRWRIPPGAAGLLVGGAAAVVAFGADELWHRAYGIDVTMWSPPHLTMITAAALSPLCGWLLLSSAGPTAGRPWARRVLPVLLAGIALAGLSAFQLEFDLGVSQWQQLYHPVLIALATGIGLVAARTAVGPGGALGATAVFLALRLAMWATTTGVWGLSEPRFPLYLGAALVVEAAFLLRRPALRAWVAGLGVGTVGLAAEWAWTHVWAWHPWTAALWPDVLVATAAAVAGAALGSSIGDAAGHRVPALHPRTVALAALVVVGALLWPLPRHVPPGTVTLTTRPADGGRVWVEVTVDPPGVVARAERWEVLAWQAGEAGGRATAYLVPAGPGRWISDRPVPTDGKVLVRLAAADLLGAVPVRFPADPTYGLDGIPLVPTRVSPFHRDGALMMREGRPGPAWPGAVGYTVWLGAVLLQLATIAAAGAHVHRRRRAHGWTRGPHPLRGRRVLLTGAAGGIGRAVRAALEAHGARVVGIDLTADRPDTLVADVTDPAALQAAVAEAVHRLGGLDVVIANAGIGVPVRATDPPDEDTRRVLEVDLLGAWATIAAAVPHLGGDGTVIGVTSGLAVADLPYAAAYAAAKRGLSAYLDVLRVETGLVVTELRPAYIATAIHDEAVARGVSLEGLVRREEVTDAAAAVVAACERPRRWLGSSPLTTLELRVAYHLPGVVDRLVRRRWQRLQRQGRAGRLQPRPDARPAADAVAAGYQKPGSP